jgi:hypothetical protein
LEDLTCSGAKKILCMPLFYRVRCAVIWPLPGSGSLEWVHIRFGGLGDVGGIRGGKLPEVGRKSHNVKRR